MEFKALLFSIIMLVIHLLSFLLFDLFTARALEKRGEFSDYVIGEMIGIGDEGYIFLANKTATQQEFAAKTLKSYLERKLTNMFDWEIDILKAISESKAPNVIQYVDSFIHPEEGKKFLVMEKANGGNLLDWIFSNSVSIQFGDLARPLIIRLMREAAQSIKQVHDLGICHRDIKLWRT